MKALISSTLNLVVALLAALNPASGKTQTLPEPYPYRLGPIRHAQLEPALVVRIRAFEPIFVDLYPVNHEQWLDGFKRDHDPESEVRIWEEIARALTLFIDGRPLTKEVRQEAFGLLLVRSGSSEEVVITNAKLKHLSQEDARRVLKLYRVQPKPVQFERR